MNRAGPARIGRDDDDMSDLQMSKALDKVIETMHPNLPEPARANIAKAEYPMFRKGWDARGVVDQLPDHAAPAAASLGDGYMMAMGNVRAYQWPRGDVLTEDDFGEFFAAIERQAPAGGLDLPAPAELEPEPVGEPAPHLLPPGWGPDVEAEYQALLQLVAGPPGERREGFLRLRHPRRLDL